MVCWRCGYEVAEGAASCQTCGAELGPNAVKQETQSLPLPNPSGRMPAIAADPVPDAATAPASPAGAAAPPVTTASAKTRVPRAPRRRSSLSPLFMLFAAGVVMAVGSLGTWQLFKLEGTAASDGTAPPASAPASGPGTTAAAPATPPTADPAAGSPAVDAAAADTSTSGPGSGPALLAATRKERDAALVQRDAALAEVKQLQADLARVHSAAPGAPVTPAPPPVDAARLTQLQKDRDTLRFIVGSKKQLMAQKVLESHLYLLPPPAGGLTSMSLADTTEIDFDAKTYGLDNVKDVTVIPSSVWENTDFKYTISGSTVKFTILKPDAFRTFAKYFVLMLQ